MLVTKASITLTREQAAEIAAVFNEEFQHDASLQTMTLLFDPEAVTAGEWTLDPDAHSFKACREFIYVYAE